MGAKQSARGRALSSMDETSGSGVEVDGGPSVSRVVPRARTRSLGSVQNGAHHSIALRFSSGLNATDGGDTDDASTPEESMVPAARFFQAASLPLHLFSWSGKFNNRKLDVNFILP